MEQCMIFTVKKDAPFANDDRLLVLCLYRPIIGPEAYHLYLALMEEDYDLDINTKYGLEEFLALLQLTKEQLLSARGQIEAIGLLKVLKREKGNKIILKPQLPVSAEAFFENQILSHHLLEKVGERNFTLLKKRFLNRPHYEDITKCKINISEPVTHLDFLQIDQFLIHKNSNHKLYLPYRTKIIQLANYHNLNTKELGQFIYQSIDLNKTARFFNWDKFQTLLSDYSQKIALKYQLQGEQLNLAINEHNTIESTSIRDAKIREMGMIDPVEYLALLSEAKPTPLEIEILRDLVLNYGLKTGVVNCLIEYVWFKNNHRIERNYCEKIANTFKQLKIETVVQAMTHLKNAYLQSTKQKTRKEVIKNLQVHKSQKTRDYAEMQKDYHEMYQGDYPDQLVEAKEVEKLIEEIKNS